MFRGFLKKSGAVCFSGGRYDRLYDQFDGDVSAVGLAFDVDVLAEHVQVASSYAKICIIATEESLVFAEKLRKSYNDSYCRCSRQMLNMDSYDQF